MTVRRRLFTLLFALGCSFAVSGAAHPAESALPRLLVPADGQVYFGFTLQLNESLNPAMGDTRLFEERAADSVLHDLGSKKPTLLSVWAPWQIPESPGKPLIPLRPRLFDIQKVEAVVGRSGFVSFDWTITNTTAANGGLTTKDVASGAVDAYIRQYAQDVRAYGRPLLIRLFGGEFNGSWWYGVSPRANPTLTPSDFVAAWRRVVNIFRAAGATNASWAWIPSAVPHSAVPWIDPDIGSYYPGDEYVDWAGGDAYDGGPPSWLDGPYSFAVAHDKPFYLAEWGVRHHGSTLSAPQQRDWIESMFDYVEARPAIKAISYFNFNARAGPGDPSRTVSLYGGRVNYQANANDNDHRLLADSGAGFRATFAQRISSPRYISNALMTTPAARRATATVISATAKGITATVRWRGNTAARTYDVSIRRGSGAWAIAASRIAASSYRFRGKPAMRASVRVRARDAAGTPGPWSPTRMIRFDDGPS